jgi:hypothetical protein
MAGRSAGRFRYCHSAKGKPVSEVNGGVEIIAASGCPQENSRSRATFTFYAIMGGRRRALTRAFGGMSLG